MPRPTLLIVDDVKECGEGLLLQLEAALGATHQLELAESAAEAREVLDALEADGGTLALVLSDLIMPQQDGARFLAELHQRQPRALKLLFSGCPRAGDLLYLLDRGRVDGFFVKPWREPEVVALIARCLRQSIWPLPPNLSLLEGSLPPDRATASEREALALLEPLLQPEGLEALLIYLDTPEGLRLSARSRHRARLSELGEGGPAIYRPQPEGVSVAQSLAHLNAADAPWRLLLPLEHPRASALGAGIVGWLLAENPASRARLDPGLRRRLEGLAQELAVLAVNTRLLNVRVG